MAITVSESLTAEQIAKYESAGFVDSIKVLTSEEVQWYCGQLEKTCSALGGRVTRLDGLHLYFAWAWELSTHPRLLDCLESLLGPNILLKSTRVFYKHRNSAAYVGWHQDGITERLTDGRTPAVWLGLTKATVENGCLRVVPRSHRVGMLPHHKHWTEGRVATGGANSNSATADANELAARHADVPEGLDPPYDVVMNAGEMSFHHPLILHGSNPNRSDGPRIGLSATYSAPELQKNGMAAALVRGRLSRSGASDVIVNSPAFSFDEGVAAYRASGRMILRAPE